ncbi:hotdog fold thioesterase [Chitinophaga japonensis]|uniref:1,4-dihydroxy-2-naphthoyl-CoA hydrolase n=1 Tax=Chitinophaga japonensis TaxID=104662 RepID=A0A562STG5_CHIJA|nr:hotdog fold thioesterase [Chitinophaga japonensis]TWI84324.1 1,4-dihydroxy-2-naphthoyl-CoA hydrolase [Chitinophaga japonensis]
MKPIWHSLDISLDQLNEMSAGTMGAHLGMEFTEIGPDYLRIMMPVDFRTVQPYGLLHGGASAAMAETAGSVASALIIDPEKQICVGMEINANHIRGVREGYVHGIARPLHLGSTTHVWDIRITDDHHKLVCVSRLTVAVLPKKE